MSVTACGFHLRGQVDLPTSLQTLTLTSESGSDEFDRALRIALTQAGVIVISQSNATTDTLNLKVNKIESSDIELAHDSSNDVSQLQRRLSSHYFIRKADGKSVYGPRQISTSKVLTNQNDSASTVSSYNSSQAKDMYTDLADQLLSDLNYAPL
jgi:LPS-assembly lipoprotein